MAKTTIRKPLAARFEIKRGVPIPSTINPGLSPRKPMFPIYALTPGEMLEVRTDTPEDLDRAKSRINANLTSLRKHGRKFVCRTINSTTYGVWRKK